MATSYTLAQLLDLALCVPEIGVVNFNILHVVIKTIIDVQGIEAMRPDYHTENPLVAKIVGQEAEYKEFKFRSFEDPHVKSVVEESSDSQRKIGEEPATDSGAKKRTDDEFDQHLATFRSGWNEIHIGQRVTALEDGLNHFSTEFDKQEEKFSEININSAVQNAKLKKNLADQTDQFAALRLEFEELKKELSENKEEEDQEEGKLSVEAEIMMLKERNEQLVYQVVDINDQVKELLKSRSLEDDLAVLSKRIEDLETDMDSLASREADAPFGAPGFGIDMPPPTFVMHKPRKLEDEEAEFEWLNKKLETFQQEKKAAEEKRKGLDLKGEVQKDPSKISDKEQFPAKKKHKHKHVETQEELLMELVEEEGIPENLSIEAVKEFLLKKVKPQEEKAEKGKVEKAKKHHIEKVTVKDLTAELEQALHLEPQKVTPGKVSLEYEKERAVQSVTEETEPHKSSFDIITKAQHKKEKKEKKEKKKKKREEKEAKKIAKALDKEKKAALKAVEEKETIVPEVADEERFEVAEKEVPSDEIEEKIEVPTPTARDELLAEVEELEFLSPKDEIEQLKTPEEEQKLSVDDEMTGSMETTSPLEVKLTSMESKAEVEEIMDEPVVDAIDVEQITRRASVKAADAVSIASTITKPISVITTHFEAEEKEMEDIPVTEKDIGFVTITMKEKRQSPSIAEVHHIEKGPITEIEDLHRLKIDLHEEKTVPVKEFEEGEIDPSIKASVEMLPDKSGKDVEEKAEEDLAAEKGKGRLHILKERTDTHVSKEKDKFHKKEELISPKKDKKDLADRQFPKEEKKISELKEKTKIDHREKKVEEKEKIGVEKEKVVEELPIDSEKEEVLPSEVEKIMMTDEKSKLKEEEEFPEEVERVPEEEKLKLPEKGERDLEEEKLEAPEKGERDLEQEKLEAPEKGERDLEEEKLEAPEKGERDLEEEKLEAPEKGETDLEEEKLEAPEKGERDLEEKKLEAPEKGERDLEEEKLEAPEKEVEITKKEISKEKVDFQEKEMDVSKEDEKQVYGEKADVSEKDKIPEVKVLEKEKISEADKETVVMKEEAPMDEKEEVQPVEEKEKKQDIPTKEDVVEKHETPVVEEAPGEGGSEKSSETSSDKSSEKSSAETDESSSEESSSSEGSESSEDEKREGRTEDFEHTVKVLEEIEAQKRKQLEKETFERLIGTRRKKKARYEVDDDEDIKLGAYGSGRGLLTEDVLDEHLKNVVTRLDATMRNKSWELDNKIRTIEEQLIQTIQKMANDFENQIQTVNEKVVNRDKHLNRRAEEIEELASSIRILKDLKADKHFVYHEITGKADITEVSKKIDMTTFFSTLDLIFKTCNAVQDKLKEQEAKLQDSLDDIKTDLAKKLYHDDYVFLQEPVENHIKSIQNTVRKLLHAQQLSEVTGIKVPKGNSWTQVRKPTQRSGSLNKSKKEGSDDEGSLSPTFHHAFIPLILPNQAFKNPASQKAARAKVFEKTILRGRSITEDASIRGNTRYVGGAHTKVKSQSVKLPFIK